MDSTEGRPVPPTYDRHRVPQPSDGKPSLAPSMVTHPGDVLPRTTTTRGSSNNRVNIKRGGDSASQDFPSDKSTLKPALRTKRPAFRSDNSVDFVPVDTVATAPPYQSPEPSPKRRSSEEDTEQEKVHGTYLKRDESRREQKKDGAGDRQRHTGSGDSYEDRRRSSRDRVLTSRGGTRREKDAGSDYDSDGRRGRRRSDDARRAQEESDARYDRSRKDRDKRRLRYSDGNRDDRRSDHTRRGRRESPPGTLGKFWNALTK